MANEQAAGGGTRGIGEAIASLGMGERIAVLGAAGVAVVWLVFSLIMDEYILGQLPFALAALALFLAYRFRVARSAGWPVPYQTSMILVAGVLGLIGVRDLLLDVRYDVFDIGGAYALGAVLYWIAAIAAGVGAWQMSRE